MLHSTLYPPDTPVRNARNALIFSAAEAQVMTLAQYHIISKNSGFGRLSVARSARWQSSFTLAPGEQRNCRSNPDTLQYLSTLPPGI